MLRDKKNYGICVCNLGIFKGNKKFNNFQS